MRHLVREAGLEEGFHLDSAGTGGWHVGAPPDRRGGAAARARGISVTGSARRFSRSDFDRFDLILAMDRSNLHDLSASARSAADRAKLRLLRDFDPASRRGAEVPDPYYGGHDGFEEVLDICEAACRGLLAELSEG